MSSDGAPSWVCLLRGVNLGQRRRLPMARLRAVLTAAGLTEVRTYLQSGNVLARSPLDTAAEVSELVGAVIADEFALDVPVITRTPAEIGAVIAASPFADQASLRANLIRVIFLAEAPAADRAGRLTGDPALAGTCRVDGRHVYVDYVRDYHNTGRTAAWFTRALGVDGTERNWRTVLALARMAASS
jgi:uncharacterized protein (DUF1697 family)